MSDPIILHGARVYPRGKLCLVPLSIRAAGLFVLHHHRHHRPPQGALFALGAEVDGQLVGVAIVGRPVAPGMQDGRTVEVTRVATDGTHNACSFLYGRCRRAAAVLGYDRVLTYTRQDESGASPRAAGFEQTGLFEARSWAESNPGRGRIDRSTPAPRIRWEAAI
ncbi:MAG: hypothetical protein JWN10_1672 [Solirubrobacterales bacterium]|nr:hypothetical protein [Solirubrobacterales bacterium]